MRYPKAGEAWEHFKGHVYNVLHLARCSETQKQLVVYERNGDVWVRPLSEWMELVSNKPIPGLGPSKNYYGQRFVKAKKRG